MSQDALKMSQESSLSKISGQVKNRFHIILSVFYAFLAFISWSLAFYPFSLDCFLISLARGPLKKCAFPSLKQKTTRWRKNEDAETRVMGQVST